jgi:hypothetical protein
MEGPARLKISKPRGGPAAILSQISSAPLMKLLFCALLIALSIGRSDTRAQDDNKLVAVGQPASATDVRALYRAMRALIGDPLLNGSAVRYV